MFQNKIYHTNKGVAMGSPISNTIAEIFLQHYENTYIKQVLNMQYIQYYTRYVDDILIIYDTSKVTHEHEHITHQFNQVHKDIKFNPRDETKNTVNFLDLQITRGTRNLHIYIENQQPLTLLYTTLQTTHRIIKPKLTDITNHDCTHYC